MPVGARVGRGRAVGRSPAIAALLAFGTQPGGATTGVAFTVQPVIHINTAQGGLCAEATNSVTAAIQSGGGSLSGTTTVAAVNGVATFTNLVITGTGDHVLRFTSSGLTLVDSATLNVAAGGGGGGKTPLMFSDWRTRSNGSALSDVNDNGKWSIGGSLSRAAVQDVTAGFPTAMVKTVKFFRSDGGSWFMQPFLDGTLPELAIGETRGVRVYLSILQPNNTNGSRDNSQHGINDGGGGGVQNFNLTTKTGDGTGSPPTPTANDSIYETMWQPNFLISNGQDRFYINSTSPHHASSLLNKDTPYRFEFQYTRVDETHFTVKAWCYESATVAANEVLVAGPSDFKSLNFPGETMASDRQYTFNHLPGTESFLIGCNGADSVSGADNSVQGGVAIVNSIVGGLAEGEEIGAYGSNNVTGEAAA